MINENIFILKTFLFRIENVLGVGSKQWTWPSFPTTSDINKEKNPKCEPTSITVLPFEQLFIIKEATESSINPNLLNSDEITSVLLSFFSPKSIYFISERQI